MPSRRRRVVALVALLASCTEPRADETIARVGTASVAGCYSYADTITLRGALMRETHPGPPNYESIAGGDAEESGYYLHLSSAICTRSGAQDVPDQAPVEGVRRVQLVLDSAGYAAFRPYLGQQIATVGVLFSAHTGHHHAPLLLSNARLL